MEESTDDIPQFWDGKKFWFSANFPMKSYYQARVKEFGAKIVHTEKSADYHFLDPLKDKHQEDCYSYKYIEDSVKARKDVGIDKYLLGPEDFRGMEKTKTGKTKGGASGKGRNAFSKEDDIILLQWIDAYPGAKLAGNTIYKELAAMYPQHTMHSWRDRWVKHLSLRPPELLPKFTPMPVPPKPKAASPDDPPLSSQAIAQRNRALGKPKVEATKRTESDIGSSSPKQARPKFSSGDDKILKGILQDYANSQTAAEAKKVLENFARDFSHHTLEEWEGRFYDLYKDDVKKLVAERKAKERAAKLSRQSVSSRDGSVKEAERTQPTEDVPSQEDEDENAESEDEFEPLEDLMKARKRKGPIIGKGDKIGEKGAPKNPPPREKLPENKQPPKSSKGHPIGNVQEEDSEEREDNMEIDLTYDQDDEERPHTPDEQVDHNPPTKPPRSPQGHPVVVRSPIGPSTKAGKLREKKRKEESPHTPEKQVDHNPPAKPPKSPQGHPVVDPPGPKDANPRRSRKIGKLTETVEPIEELVPAATSSKKRKAEGEHERRPNPVLDSSGKVDAYALWLNLEMEKKKRRLRGGAAKPIVTEKHSPQIDTEPESEAEAEPDPIPPKRVTRAMSREPVSERPKAVSTRRRHIPTNPPMEIRETPEPSDEDTSRTTKRRLMYAETQDLYAVAQIETQPDSYDETDQNEDNGAQGYDQQLIAELVKKYDVDESVVEIALEKTSEIRELVEKVLLYYKEENEFPYHIPGVFSVEDDEIMQKQANMQLLQELESKHGKEYFNARYSWLNKQALRD